MHRRYQTIIQNTVDPAGGDNAYELGQQWINTTTGNIFFLKSIVVGVATWIDVTNASALIVHPSADCGSIGSNVVIANELEVGDTLDAILLTGTMRVLLKDQTDPKENGIYTPGTPATRVADLPGAGTFGGDFVFVSGGTVNAKTGWAVSGTGTTGTDNMLWYQFSAAGTYTGTQLGGGSHVYKQLSGTAFEFRSVIGQASRLVVTQNANDLTLTLDPVVVCTDQANNWGAFDQTFDTDLLVIKQATNRIGINKAAPAVALDVVGAAAVSAGLTVDTDALVVDSATHRVGIKTAAPSVELDVVGQTKITSGTWAPLSVYRTQNATGSVYGAILLERSAFGTPVAGVGAAIHIKAPNDASASKWCGTIQGLLSTVTAGAEVGDLRLNASWQGAEPTTQPHLVIRAVDATLAKIGINLAAPTSHLHVNGSLANDSILSSSAVSIVLGSTHFVVILTHNSGQAVTLPLASSCKGRIYIIKDLNTSGVGRPTVSVVLASGDSIDGVGTSFSTRYLSSYMLMSNGVSTWGRIAQYDA